MFRDFAEQYGWPPDVVKRLTWFQILMYRCESRDLGGVQQLNSKDARVGYRQRRQFDQAVFE
jgi:hypothetical protein